MHFGGYDIKLCHILQKLGGHAPKNTELMTVNFSIWVAILRNGTVSGDFDLLKSKLGGYAPEWVAMLRNRTVPEGYFGGKIVILGGFAPEISTVSKPPKLGGHAPEHPLQSYRWFLRKETVCAIALKGIGNKVRERPMA